MGHQGAPRHAQVDTVVALRTEDREGPAPAGPSCVRRLGALATASVLLLGGCAVGGGREDEHRGALPEKLAEPAQPLAATPTDEAGAALSLGSDAGASPARPRSGSGSPTTARNPRAGPAGDRGSTTTTTAPAPNRTVVDLVDATGDAGIQARPYGDLVRLRIEDDGTRARVTVAFAGDLPSPPEDGEVMGVGVDLYRGDGDDSDYQLYALGNGDGWRAGLQAGPDWVDYPGTFELGADRLVFTVPWSSLGGRGPGAVTVFADWAQKAVAVVAEASEDHLPDRGAHPFSF